MKFDEAGDAVNFTVEGIEFDADGVDFSGEGVAVEWRIDGAFHGGAGHFGDIFDSGGGAGGAELMILVIGEAEAHHFTLADHREALQPSPICRYGVLKLL